MKAYRANLKLLLPLLLLLFLQTGGLWLGIKSLQFMRMVQQEIRAKSNPANAVKFTLSKSDFGNYALDNDKELNIEGRMFDVISIETKGNLVIVTALEDAFEERLMALLTKTTESSNNKNSGDAFLLALMHLQFISPADKIFEFLFLIPNNNATFSDVKISWITNWQFDVEQPPENKRNII